MSKFPELQKKALKHYDNMISWVETQILLDSVHYYKMNDAINEDWFSASCSYCKIFYIISIRIPLHLIKSHSEDTERSRSGRRIQYSFFIISWIPRKLGMTIDILNLFLFR